MHYHKCDRCQNIEIECHAELKGRHTYGMCDECIEIVAKINGIPFEEMKTKVFYTN
jgi:hypothetical protein